MYHGTGASKRSKKNSRALHDLSMPGITACYRAALSSEIRAKSPSKTRDVTGFKSLTNIVHQLHVEEDKAENGKIYQG